MKKLYVLVLLFFSSANLNAQKDIENSKDYPLLDRLPNYTIMTYNELEFGSHLFFIDGKKKAKEGRKFTIEYRHNSWKDRSFQFPSRLKILRNYSNAIVKAGGSIIFERYNAEHGYYSFKTANGKEIWLQVKTAINGNSYTLIIIEKQPMRQDIVIDAELIKNTLDIEGKIAIYGILFDMGKSIIKKESLPAIKQIAEYLKNNPMVKCWVVGHTDSDGSFEINSKLSLDRAKAIKSALQVNYGIANDRLFAEGVGPLAPVATNATDEGKRLNRRVELVKK